MYAEIKTTNMNTKSRIASHIDNVACLQYIKYQLSMHPIALIADIRVTVVGIDNPLYTRQCVVWYLSPTKGERPPKNLLMATVIVSVSGMMNINPINNNCS